VSDLTDERLDEMIAWSADGRIPDAQLALLELQRRRAEQAAGREHVERVVVEACELSQSYKPDARDLARFEAMASYVAGRLSVPVLSEDEVQLACNLRAYVKASTGMLGYPDPGEAARECPIPASWVTLLDRLIAARKP